MRRFPLASVAASCVLAFAAPALAAADCPPVGHLPTYSAGDPPETRSFDEIEFTVQKGDETATVKVRGATCKQVYSPKDGTDPLSDLEIQSNYRDQLNKLGAQTLFQDDRNTVAKLAKGDNETWISVYSQETEIDVTVLNKQPLKQTLTAPSGADYRLLGHMPTYEASTPEKHNFDKVDFTVQNGDDTQTVSVEGKTYKVAYTPEADTKPESDLAIQTNYRAAINALGGQILFQDDRDTTGRLEKDGTTIWVSIYSQETEIDVSAVEEKPFQATIQAATADAMKSALDKDGRIALYIDFDFNKATIRPDGKPIIAQVIALMKNNPDLKISVEGNTDNIGTHDYNVKLSQERAAAVVAAVAAGGIDKARMVAKGNGPDKPIADNTTDAGRAKNRRVELVKA